MKIFQVYAEVRNIYGNGQNVIATTYSAESHEKALQGFIEYLKSNNNLISFSNIIVSEV